MSKGWRRLIVISCTLLLVGSVFMVLGITVWAQEQPPPTEQPTGTEQPTAAEQLAQPAQPAQPIQVTQQQGLVIDYWEPQVGTRTVYFVNDYLNDLYGDYYDTTTVGYRDVSLLWQYRPNSVVYRVPHPANYTSSHYRGVEAASDINACYFNLEGPWYFNMTTPYKIVEEVIGIHAAPDAGQFPYATYAISRLVIGSGGHRTNIIVYTSNDANAKEWREWGYSHEYVQDGHTTPTKEVVRYLSPYEKGMPIYSTIKFPLSVGTAGAVIPATTSEDDLTYPCSVEIVAEGKITVPGGTYDALLMKYVYTIPRSRVDATRIEYRWFVKDIGAVAGVKSLPNIPGPTYEEATGYYSERRDKIWHTSKGMWVLESFAPALQPK